MKKIAVALAILCASPLLAKQIEQRASTPTETTYGYLMSYILQGTTTRTNACFLAYSKDGAHFTAMNNNKAVVYPLLGSKMMRQPSIFRKAEGGFGLITTDNNSQGLLLYHSPDLITYHNESYLTVNNQQENIVDIRCHYDATKAAYAIQWRTEAGQCYESLTTDFTTLQPAVAIPPFSRPTPSGVVPERSLDHSVIGLSQAEYERVTNKYAKVTNTAMAPLQPVVTRKGEAPILPNRVTAQYSDGSTKQMGVKWDETQLETIQQKKPGTYTLKGVVQQPEYSAPLIAQRADPWVFKGDDNYYYFTASYPMVGHDDPNGYDRVILRRSSTIEGLATAEEISIWHEKDCPSCYRYVWAPEIHQIDGTWFVFFTTSLSDNVWHIRPRVIACNQGDKDPYKPENWEEVGHIMDTVEGDDYSCNHFSLDMTHFSSNGKHYVAWAEKPGTSDILLATVDGKEPWKMTSSYTLLTKPEYAWEHDGNTWVNEGPAVIKNNGKIYLAYSASAVNHTYCVGFVYADEDADLLDPNAWTKLRYPILSTEDLPKEQNGPGHNSFTVDEYGNPMIIYHARNPQETIDGGLYDPGRHAFAKSVNFAADGMPILNMTREQELDPNHRTVTIEVIVTK